MPIRPAEPQDTSAIAAIHKARFAHGHLLGHFSVSFLTLLYDCYLDRCIFLVHQTGRRVDGFVVGGESHQLAECQLDFVRRRWLSCLAETALRPHIWVTVARRGTHLLRSRFIRRARNRDQGAVPRSFRLLSIAVADCADGTGVAAELLDAFEHAIGPMSTGYGLTVAKSNGRAIRFYEKVGFEVDGQSGDDLSMHKSLTRNPASE